MYVFILQQENNTQNIMPEGQQGAYSLLPQQKCLEQIYMQQLQYDRNYRQ